MEAIFTRLLQVLWVLHLIFSALVLGSEILNYLSGNHTELTENLIYVAFFSTLFIIAQYILLGNFNPKILFKRKRRYPI